MKRELKFRAFGTIGKYKNQMFFMNNPYFAQYIASKITMPDKEPNIDIEIMQFTGLKDKNGKEIYEGDVLALPRNSYIEEGNHQVIYYADGFVTVNLMFRDLETANKNSLSWMIKRGAVVVGTIYDKKYSRL